MKHLTRKDWYAALLCVALGMGIAWGSTRYGMGTAARMGPGYFPFLLGVLLVVVGVLLLVAPEEPDEVNVDAGETPDAGQSSERRFKRARPWVCVVIGMLLFMGVGTYGGFIPATFLLILVSAFGDQNNTLKGALILASATTVASIAVFHYALQMQFPLFSWG